MGARVLCACANGSGAALMMQLTLETAARDVGLPLEVVHHCALAEGKQLASLYTLVLVPADFARLYDDVADQGGFIVPIENVLSLTEMRTKLAAYMNEKGDRTR